MKHGSQYVCMFAILFVLSACNPAPEPAPEPTPAPEPAPEPPAPMDNISGTWTGDWGPNPQDRNEVTLEIEWDGSVLTGTITSQFAPDPVDLTGGSYDPATGTVTMSASAPGRGGAVFDYAIQGQIEGNMMTGAWSHDDQQGDFVLTMM